MPQPLAPLNCPPPAPHMNFILPSSLKVNLPSDNTATVSAISSKPPSAIFGLDSSKTPTDSIATVAATSMIPNNFIDSVNFSAYAPAKISPKDEFLLNIYAYIAEQFDKMNAMATADGGTSKGTKSGVSVKIGTEV